VDPSPVMRSHAARRCRQWQSAGRVDIAAGTADQLPLPDAACDTVVAANTVVMWPDLAAGLHEIKRVLRPDGRLVLSWHSATAPSRTSRRLALSDASPAHSATRYTPPSATSSGMTSPTPSLGRRNNTSSGEGRPTTLRPARGRFGPSDGSTVLL
jgi:SAM-dependent methyltransferase